MSDDDLDKRFHDLCFQPRLSQRYGPANPGQNDRERNLWAAGASWFGRQLAEEGFRLPLEMEEKIARIMEYQAPGDAATVVAGVEK